MASTPATPAVASTKHDLTSTLSKFLDLHLVLPLLDFMEDQYDHADLQRARLALSKHTNMVDYTIELHQEVEKTDDIPADMKAQFDMVKKQMDMFDAQDKTLSTFFEELVRPPPPFCLVCAFALTQVVSQFNASLDPPAHHFPVTLPPPLLVRVMPWFSQEAGRQATTFSEGQPLSLAWLEENMGVSGDAVQGYYQQAKFEFECGDYAKANAMLSNFLLIEEHKASRTPSGFAAQWGKFAAVILLVSHRHRFANFTPQNMVIFLLFLGITKLESLPRSTKNAGNAL